MDSLAFSPNLLINLLMDNQEGASSSILISIVLGYPRLKKMQASCGQMHNFSFF
jgi:hypothetical protein